MPIITCSGRRAPKVATEIVDKGKCASKVRSTKGLMVHVFGKMAGAFINLIF